MRTRDRRYCRLIGGGLLIALGLVLIPTPVIPGTPVILLGLGVLASDLTCARRLKESLSWRRESAPRRVVKRKVSAKRSGMRRKRAMA